MLPHPDRLPGKYLDLLDWYERDYRWGQNQSIDEDPVLALRGVGKELWRDLGGGEKFIRESRESWDERPAKVSDSERSAVRQKKAI